MKPIRVAIVGVGGRGRGLAQLLCQSPRPVEIAAIVDPVRDTLTAAGELLGVGREKQFADHRELLAKSRDLDGAIVATDVRSHYAIARDIIDAGVPLFLEKPITRTIEEAIELYRLVKGRNARIFVGFNLRYGPFYKRLKELVAGGAVGEVISIEWKEVLSPGAWGGGYCRASWYSREKDVGGWLLEKSCHDIDQINWLVDAPCERTASFGSRAYFLPRADLPQRCTDNCPIEKECCFSCFKLHPDGPTSVPHYLPPDRWDLCVYHSGSDLVDRQVAVLEYRNGVTAAFSLLPVGNCGERVMRICGSTATLRGSDSASEIQIWPHGASVPTAANPPETDGEHGGADPEIMNAFLEYLADPSSSVAVPIEVGLEAMLTAGGIETARRERRVVELGEYRCRI